MVGAGWLDLDNARGRIKADHREIELVGTDDPHLGWDRYDEVSGAPDAAADIAIAVTHAPYRRVLDAMVADGFPLVLAGHTHGGQLCLPGVGALVTNCDLPRRQAKGLSRWSSGERLVVAARLGRAGYVAVRPRAFRVSARGDAAHSRAAGALTGAVGTATVGSARLPGFQRGVAQLGSALRSGRRGRGFKSRHPDG